MCKRPAAEINPLPQTPYIGFVHSCKEAKRAAHEIQMSIPLYCALLYSITLPDTKPSILTCRIRWHLQSFLFRRVKHKQVFYPVFQYRTQFAQDKHIQPRNIICTVIINLFPAHFRFMRQLVFAHSPFQQ